MALRASSPLVGSVPIPRTRLIGRADERAAARMWLLDEAVPVLTLTGPGGVGKTRLALEIAADVAASFADGVVWVDLSALTDPAVVPDTVAVALGLAPTPDRPIDHAIAEYLRSRQVLLLLDNCEHVVAATAALVSDILDSCLAVQVLATSRALLRLRGEQNLPVEPLPLPAEEAPALDAATQNEAIRLFVERAHAVRPAFALTEANAPIVAALCRQLDGLPLAIELAAARISSLSPEALLTRMMHRLPLLSDGPRDLPMRQQTMRDTISWSYDLLDPDRRALFRRLSVFMGGFNLDAARAVHVPGLQEELDTERDLLVVRGVSALVDHNLVRRGEHDGEPRFTMLETVREFGLERLVAEGEEAESRTRHAHYFLALVDALDANVAPHLPEADRVLRRLEAEHPNLRAALGWFRSTGQAEELVRLAGALHAFWLHYGYTREGREWLEQALALGGSTSAPARVWALVGLFAMLWNQQAEEARALALIEEAVALARDSGDPLSLALATIYRSAVDSRAGVFARAERTINEARVAFGSLPPAPWIARNLTHVDWALSNLALLQGDFSGAEARALAVVERQRALEREHDAPYPYVSRPQIVLGHIARVRGEPASALGHYQGALHDAARCGEVRGVVFALGGIAGILAVVGRWAEAARLFGATEASCELAGIGFSVYVFDWQRAMGLPEPWQQAGASFGVATTLRSAAQEQTPGSLPPLPEPAAAARLWVEGRNVPLAEAIAEALAVDLAAPASFPTGLVPSVMPARDRFGLSPREGEVLALLCQRLSDAEIGEALFISPRTASRHVANLFNKLGVDSRREAAALAARLGLI